MTFQSNLESLRTHQVPEWYHDAKLGIFIHWGLYSVPGYAPLSGDISKLVAEQGWEAAFANNPYAEWYLNSLKFENSPTRRYHEATYGTNFRYDDFVPLFNRAVQVWDPREWAALFRQAGARYAVLTTKHHDGFTLWPTARPCPRKANYSAARDLVGDLTNAVRDQSLRMGLYYSGGLDWAFNPARIQQLSDLSTTIVQEPEFVGYANGHWRELIARYQPSLMWNDIGYPTAANLPELFADYYNHVPDGVINDRFRQSRGAETFDNQDMNEAAVAVMRGAHYDFVTPEYGSFQETQQTKWECCRGIGHSFAFNRNEGEEQYASVESLVHMLADIVSKNGNLLLGIGPMADGTIPEGQRQRLIGLGRWLEVNGDAIFGTRPWVRAEGQTDAGIGARFTRRGETLYATILGAPPRREITMQGLHAAPDAIVRILGRSEALPWQQEDSGLRVTLPENLRASPAHCLKIAPASAG